MSWLELHAERPYAQLKPFAGHCDGLTEAVKARAVEALVHLLRSLKKCARNRRVGLQAAARCCHGGLMRGQIAGMTTTECRYVEPGGRDRLDLYPNACSQRLNTQVQVVVSPTRSRSSIALRRLRRFFNHQRRWLRSG